MRDIAKEDFLNLDISLTKPYAAVSQRALLQHRENNEY